MGYKEATESIGGDKGSVTLATKTILASHISNFQMAPPDWKPTADIFACLEVTDSGCEITEEDMDRLFDPFFTTKFTGRGLGLAGVLRIVKPWSGAISVESTRDGGSTFRVILPLVTGQVPRQAEKTADAGKKAKGGTALLVEDQDKVRKMAEAMIKNLGFVVLAAANGTEAVAAFREHCGHYPLCDHRSFHAGHGRLGDHGCPAKDSTAYPGDSVQRVRRSLGNGP